MNKFFILSNTHASRLLHPRFTASVLYAVGGAGSQNL